MKNLFKTRVIPAFNKMYKEAVSAYPNESIELDYEKICKCSIEDAETGKKLFPYDAFYLNDTRIKAIVEEACKGLKHWWRWPYKSQFIYSPQEIKRMKEKLADIEDKDSFEYRDLEHTIKMNPIYKKQDRLWKSYQKELKDLDNNMCLSSYKRNKLKNELAKKYNLRWYSRDEEGIKFTLYLNMPTPTSNLERVNKLKEVYLLLLKWIEADNKLEEFKVNETDNRDAECAILMYKFYQNYSRINN